MHRSLNTNVGITSWYFFFLFLFLKNPNIHTVKDHALDLMSCIFWALTTVVAIPQHENLIFLEPSTDALQLLHEATPMMFFPGITSFESFVLDGSDTETDQLVTISFN